MSCCYCGRKSESGRTKDEGKKRKRDSQSDGKQNKICIFNSPVGAVAKYCDEHVCVSVCPRGYPRTMLAIYTKFVCACCIWLWLGPPAL